MIFFIVSSLLALFTLILSVNGEPSEIYSPAYEIEFIYGPKVIIGNIPFDIYVEARSLLKSALNFLIPVYLTCGGVEIYMWSDVVANELSTLSPIPSGTPAHPYCFLSSPTQADGYSDATWPVSIVASPFGGIVNPITSAQQAEFAVDIAFPPSVVIV